MAASPIVSFKGASIFHGNHLVLKDISFSIDCGEFVYFIGKVGSGKTSLIKTINAELPLKKGEAVVGDYSLHKLKKKQIPFLRRKMGVVFQDFQLLSDRSVYDNLMFVLQATGWKKKAAPDKRIKEVLQKVGLEDKGYKMPHQLSGGEQQRVVIARALLNNPALILADEPTGNLDPETSSEIMDLLIDIKNAGQTVVMITHNYNLLKKYPFRTIKLENGALTETQALQEIDFKLLMEDGQKTVGTGINAVNDLFATFYPEIN
ncbi:MAG: ATP-binding cassette domain-containing protein [Bacteroidales bacterium]|jgi:cell division transport system ATP-binding protein|nr:ATP-binding cassette domain-containing protein [Bacteroidales bacterium]